MRENKGFIACCILFGASVFYEVYTSHINSTISDITPFLLLVVVGFVLFFVAIFRVIKDDYLFWPQRLVPLYFWVGPIVLCLIYQRWLDRIDYEPNWLRITNHQSVGYAGFDFKKNGRYKYETGSPLGLFFSYGKYVRTDSLLTIHPESANDRPIDTTLVIRPYLISSNPCFTKAAVLVPLSKNKEAVRTNLYYIVGPPVTD